MMYKWLESREHTIETFNKIFNLSQLTGFKKTQEVELGDIQVGGLRAVKVGGRVFRMELRCSNMSILLGDDEFEMKLNKNEQRVYDYLLNVNEDSYDSIKDRLKLTRNTMEKAITSLKGKQVITTEGFNTRWSTDGKIVKLL